MQGAEKGQAVNLDGRVMHVGIVQARFNDALTGQMAKICIEELIAMGVEADNIRHVTVPGALEVPVALQAMAESGYITQAEAEAAFAEELNLRSSVA